MRKKHFASFLSAVFISGIAAAAASCASSAPSGPDAMSFASSMGAGWNLGNTFDSLPGRTLENGLDAETAWGNPRTTRKLIRFIHEQGFDTIRIPVSWGPHIGPAPEYKVDPAWMNRVSEVVDWALAEKMYVILNVHHEGEWMNAAAKDYEPVMARYRALWRQIAEHFRDSTNHLIFESMNEIGFSSLEKAESAALVNRINTEFVRLIRASGGGNPKRFLLLPGNLADLDAACAYLTIPDGDPRCMASVHYYMPPQFAIAEPGTSWGYQFAWGSPEDRAAMDAYFAKLKTSFTDKGIPVILGEYGCLFRDKDRASRIDYFRSIVKHAQAADGICPVFWDNGEELDRRAFVWRQEGVLPALLGQ